MKIILAIGGIYGRVRYERESNQVQLHKRRIKQPAWPCDFLWVKPQSLQGRTQKQDIRIQMHKSSSYKCLDGQQKKDQII